MQDLGPRYSSNQVTEDLFGVVNNQRNVALLENIFDYCKDIYLHGIVIVESLYLVDPN